MKLSITKPASISRVKKSILVSFALLFAFAVPIQVATQVKADKYDDIINALQQDINDAQAQATQLSAQAKTLQSAISLLQNKVSIIQSQIDLSQAKYDKLVVQIADTEKKIQDNQDALGQTIADLYVEDKVSPIEMLASSSNIGDYLDKQEYRNSVREELLATIGKVKDLKASLAKQKSDVEKVLGDQQNSKNALAKEQSNQQNLLNETQGQEAAYQQLAASAQARQAEVQAQQQAYLASLYNSGGGARLIAGGAAPDYPWTKSSCPMGGELGYNGNLVYYSFGGSNGEGGDGHSYGCRQCASYVAWRVARETNYYPENWGNATNFPESAGTVGYSSGSAPRAGSIGVIRGSYNAPEGHVVWVESVNGDGTLTVSQYNYNYNWPSALGWGLYSKMVVPASSYNVYIYIK